MMRRPDWQDYIETDTYHDHFVKLEENEQVVEVDEF